MLGFQSNAIKLFADGIGFREALSFFGLLCFIFYTVGLNKQLNNPEPDITWMTDINIQYALIALLMILIIRYIYVLVKKPKIHPFRAFSIASDLDTDQNI